MTLIDVTADTAVQLASPLFYSFGSPADAWTLSGICAVCGPYNLSLCVADCNGVYLGNASLDACGECSGGSTSVQPNMNVNCAGTCGGGAFGTAANGTVADCLCQQLFYPPVVAGWTRGGNLTGAFIGPIAYYVGSGQFEAASCLVSGASVFDCSLSLTFEQPPTHTTASYCSVGHCSLSMLRLDARVLPATTARECCAIFQQYDHDTATTALVRIERSPQQPRRRRRLPTPS